MKSVPIERILIAAALFLAVTGGGYMVTDTQPWATSFLPGTLFGSIELAFVNRLLVALLGLGGLAVALMRRRVINLPNLRVLLLAGIFGFIVTYCAVLSPFRVPALGDWTIWAIPLGLFLAVIALNGRAEAGRLASAAMVAGATVHALRGILDYADRRIEEPTYRIFAGAQNPNILAGILCVGIILALGLALSSARPAPVLAGSAAVIQACALVLTQSRGGYLALLVALVLFAALLFAWKSGRKAALLALPVAAAVLFSVSLTAANRSLTPGSSTTLQRIANAESTREQSLGFRINLWRTSLALTRDNPMGSGLATFWPNSSRPGLTSQTAHAHQTYLQLGVETGILGLGTFLAFLIAWFAAGIKGARSQPTERKVLTAGFISAAVAVLALGMTETTTVFFALQVMLFACLGLALLASADGVAPEQSPQIFRLGATIAAVVVPILFTALLSANSVAKSQALAALESREPALAQSQIESAIGRVPFDGEAFLIRSVLAPNPTARISDLVVAANNLPNSRTLRRLADAQRDAGLFDDAIASYNRALDVDPYSLVTLRNLMLAQATAGTPQAASDTARRLIAVESTPIYQIRALPDFVPTETAEARAFLATQTANPDERKQLLTEALDIYRDYARTTVPFLKRMTNNNPDLDLAGDSLARARERMEKAIELERELQSLEGASSGVGVSDSIEKLFDL